MRSDWVKISEKRAGVELQ
jgi:hypothetical protein